LCLFNGGIKNHCHRFWNLHWKVIENPIWQRVWTRSFIRFNCFKLTFTFFRLCTWNNLLCIFKGLSFDTRVRQRQKACGTEILKIQFSDRRKFTFPLQGT
jgi:hypothetical protein